MWSLSLDCIEAPAISVAAAICCSLISQHLFSRGVELYSETLSWIILLALSTVAQRGNVETTIPDDNQRPHNTSPRSIWVVAGALAIASLARAETGVIVLFPALAPMLIATERYFGPDSVTTRTSRHSILSHLHGTVWGTALAALFCIFTLSNGNIRACALSIVPVIALLIVYAAFLPRAREYPYNFPAVENIEEAIISLSWRAVCMLLLALGVQAAAFGSTSIKVAPVLLGGLAKAFSWFFMIRAARGASWGIAASIGTFSIMATCDPFMHTSETTAISYVAASLISLGQVVHILPKQVKARSYLWVFALVPLAPYLANIIMIKMAQSTADRSFSKSKEHPVELLIQSANTDFEDFQQRQSANYTAAHDEYRRRYGISPPNGFKDWFEFAVSHQSPVIDDFDAMYESISPLWRLSGREIIETMKLAKETPGAELWNCEYSNEGAETHCSHSHRTFDRHISLMFSRLSKYANINIPTVSFLVNHLDEPRVILPPDTSKGRRQSFYSELLNLTDLSRRPIWETLTKFCEFKERQETSITQNRTETYGFPFVTDRSWTIDLCQHPEYSSMHGLVIRPTSFRLIEGSVPVISAGAPSTMGDILFPSPSYIEPEFQYDDSHDVAWGEKRNNLYWAGSTSGAFAENDQWRSFHRQRFVALTQNLEHKQHYYLRESGGKVDRLRSWFLNGRLFDVAFTRVYQCARRACRDQSAYFHVKDWADKNRVFYSRLAFDTDGNGISGRFYMLLASRSAPLKQTLLREWHDDRLVPWVHYVPVSQSMEELPELVNFLTLTRKGQQRARMIAEQGREWFSKAFREVDLDIYLYRLLLEMARLQDSEREPIRA